MTAWNPDSLWRKEVAAIVLVHPSNYRVVGYASRPPRREVVALAREAGALLGQDPWGLPGEPTPREALAEGVDLATFSGDKLMGGPQAGIVAGKRDLVARLPADPVLRCLRPDKVTLAALEATLRLYGDPVVDPGPALARVPVLRALTWRRLAAAEPSVVGRRHHDALLLDLRSVADEEVPELAEVLASVLKGGACPCSEREGAPARAETEPPVAKAASKAMSAIVPTPSA